MHEATAGLGSPPPPMSSSPRRSDKGPGVSVWGRTHEAFPFSPQEFEDLDEIVARYVQPMASFARDLLNHKYYQDCSGGDRKVSAGPLEDDTSHLRMYEFPSM